MSKNKALSLLGLCQRARKLQAGEFLSEKTIQSRKGVLVIIAEDASDNTKKKFISHCQYYKIQYRIFGSKETLGKAIGKAIRATIVITDKGFAQSIIKEIDAQD